MYICIYVPALAAPPLTPSVHGLGCPSPPSVGFGWWVSFGFLMFSLIVPIVFCNCVLMGFIIVFFVFRYGLIELFSHGFPYHFIMFIQCFPCGLLLYFYSFSHSPLVFCMCAVCYGILVVVFMLSHGFK